LQGLEEGSAGGGPAARLPHVPALEPAETLLPGLAEGSSARVGEEEPGAS